MAAFGDIDSNITLAALQGVRRNSGNTAFEAVTITIDGLLPSQTGNNGKFLTTNGTAASWGTVSTGITIGSTSISSGTNSRFLYQASGVASQTARLTYDGTSIVVGDTASRTSTEIVFKIQADGGLGNYILFEQKAAGDVVFRDRFNVSVFSYNSSSEIWSSPKTFEIAEIRSSSRYLTPKLVGYNDNNRELNIDQTGIAFRVTDASNNAKLWQMYSQAATAQFELGYDTSNHLQVKVSSAGAVTFNATGASAGFTFSDAVTLSESLTIADAKNIILDTTTGTKIGTSTSQKLGFFNATPVTQRSNIGVLTDSTAGASGSIINTVIGGGDTIDASACDDNFRRLLDRVNAIEQVFQDLGLTS